MTSIFGGGSSINVNASGTLVPQAFTPADGQTLFSITLFTYTINTNSLLVFVNGTKQKLGSDFIETSSSSFTLTSAVGVDDSVEVIGFPLATITQLDGTAIYANLSASSGSSLVGYLPSGTGAVATTVQEVLHRTINVNDYGADPTGVADSYAAFVLAIAATPTGGTLEVNGFYRISAALTISKSMTIQGVDSRIGNVSSGANSKSFLYFGSNTDGFVVDGCVLTADRLVIVGLVGTSTKYGIKTINVNNSLILQNSVIQGFNRGLSLSSGYYNKLVNSTLTACDIGLYADGCYNIVSEALTINLNTTVSGVGIALVNASSLTMLGGSIENFGGTNSYGLGLFGGSSASIFGTYFEGDVARPTGWNVYIAANGSYVGIGCHVYLTGCARHVSIEGGGATGTRVLSENNRFVYPTDTQTCDVYTLLNTDSTADWKISGDNWNTGAGVNTKYMASGSSTVTYGTGNFNIKYPANHANYGKNLLSTPVGITGNWTPNVQGLTTGGAGTGTYTGKYTKIGNVVTVTAYISQSAHTGTGAMVVSGLPYTANNYSAATIGYVNNLSLTAGNAVMGYISTGGAYINIMQSPTGGGLSSTVPIDVGFDMMLSCTYLAS